MLTVTHSSRAQQARRLSAQPHRSRRSHRCVCVLLRPSFSPRATLGALVQCTPPRSFHTSLSSSRFSTRNPPAHACAVRQPTVMSDMQLMYGVCDPSPLARPLGMGSSDLCCMASVGQFTARHEHARCPILSIDPSQSSRFPADHPLAPLLPHALQASAARKPTSGVSVCYANIGPV